MAVWGESVEERGQVLLTQPYEGRETMKLKALWCKGYVRNRPALNGGVDKKTAQ